MMAGEVEAKGKVINLPSLSGMTTPNHNGSIVGLNEFS